MTDSRILSLQLYITHLILRHFHYLTRQYYLFQRGIVPVLLDKIGRLLRNGVDTADDIATDVVRKDTGISDSQTLHAVDLKSGVDRATHGARAARVVLADAVLLGGGAALGDAGQWKALWRWVHALACLALHGRRADELLAELQARCHHSHIGWVVEVIRVDCWVLCWVGRLDVDGAACDGVLHADGEGDAVRLVRARWRRPKFGLVGGAVLEVACSPDEDQLEVGRFRAPQMRDHLVPLFLLELVRRLSRFDALHDFL